METLAARTEQAFRTATRTVSIRTIAEQFDPDVVITRERGEVTYTFFDRSQLRTKGRGRNHSVEVVRANGR